jgi:predicted HicB family RNase H-like nuclease
MARLKTKSGTELSANDVNALADEAQTGYDLTRAKRVRTGRPSLGKDGESPRIHLRLEPELARAVRSRARREKRSLSDVARAALRQYVEKH